MTASKGSQRKHLERDVNNNNNNKRRMILRSDVNDRISQLPDYILDHILSFLTAKEVAHMSAMSKTWCRVRASYPHLVFNEELFRHCEKTEFPKKGDKFMNIVNNTILKFCEQKICMEKFQLYMTMYDVEHSTHVDHWMKLAIENGVNEIDILITREKHIPPYDIPQTLFVGKTLAILKLWGCQLKHPLFGDTTMSHSLRELSLVNILADENIIQNFIFCCPLIENLAVVMCRGAKSLRISGLVKLKKVELREHGEDKFDGIEIVKVPGLQVLQYDAFRVLFKIDETSSKNIEVLELKSFSGITDELFESLISKCTLVKTLRVFGGICLRTIKISSHRLQDLTLCMHSMLDTTNTIDTPNLHSFTYGGCISVLFTLTSNGLITQVFIGGVDTSRSPYIE